MAPSKLGKRIMLIARKGISLELDFIQGMPVAKKLRDCILTAPEGGCDHWCVRRQDNPVIREASPFFFVLQELSLLSRDVPQRCTAESPVARPRPASSHPLLPTTGVRLGSVFSSPALGMIDLLQRSCPCALPDPRPRPRFLWCLRGFCSLTEAIRCCA